MVPIYREGAPIATVIPRVPLRKLARPRQMADTPRQILFDSKGAPGVESGRGDDMSETPDLKIEHVDPATLTPAGYNPRTITDAQRSALRGSIEAFGMVEPIIARRSGEVIGGHQRLAEALDAGLDAVPVVFLDDISDDDAKRLNLALNKISGEWQPDKLAALMGELSAVPGLDLDVTGFTLPERKMLIDFPELGPELDEGIAAGVTPCVCGKCGHEHAKAQA